MTGMRLGLLATVLALSACASDDGNAGSGIKQVEPGQGKVVDVEIIVGSKPDLDARCAGTISPTAVFVVSQKQVYHCIANKLHDHAEHGKTPAMDASIVRVAANDRIRWFSKASLFTVTSVTKQDEALGPYDKRAPDMPFGNAFSDSPASEVVSTPVPDLPGQVVQRYKVAFNIQGIGPVDPDVVCSM